MRRKIRPFDKWVLPFPIKTAVYGSIVHRIEYSSTKRKKIVQFNLFLPKPKYVLKLLHFYALLAQLVEPLTVNQVVGDSSSSQSAISGCSAVGSAPALGAGCRVFEPHHSGHHGAMVQLGERFHCKEEVCRLFQTSSTKYAPLAQLHRAIGFYPMCYPLESGMALQVLRKPFLANGTNNMCVSYNGYYVALPPQK